MTTKRAQRKTILRAGTATLLLGTILGVAGITVAPAGAHVLDVNDHQIEICHATGSTENPYTTPTPAKWQITSPNGHGYLPADGSHDADIIPPFPAGEHGGQTWTAYPGQNWTGNEAFYATHCGEPSTGPRTGDVTLAKVLAGGDAIPSDAPTTFDFSVVCDSGTVADPTPTIVSGADPVAVATDVELDDTCTITETSVPTGAAVTFDVGTPGTNSTTVVVGSTNGVDVTATNTYTSSGCTVDCDVPTGSITVDKVVDGNNRPPGQTFPFTVDCTVGDVVVDLDPTGEGTQASFDLTDAADPFEVPGIPTDASCTVAETHSKGAQQTTVKVGAADPTTAMSVSNVTVAEDATTEVVVTNTFNAVGCTVDCSVPTPSLSASRSCATGGVLITVSNAGDAAGAVNILSGMDQPFSHSLQIPAGGTDAVLVPLAEDSDYLVTVTDVTGLEVATFRGPRDCVAVGGVVVSPTPPAPTPAVTPVEATPVVRPAAAPVVEVAGVVVTRELPRTGNNSLTLLQIGLGLILLGAGTMLLGRERSVLS